MFKKPSPLKHEPWTKAHKSKQAHSNTREAHLSSISENKAKYGTEELPEEEERDLTAEEEQYLESINEERRDEVRGAILKYGLESVKEPPAPEKEQPTPEKEQPAPEEKWDFKSTWLKEAKKEVPTTKSFDFEKTLEFDKPKVETVQETQQKYEEQQTSIVDNLNEEDKENIEEAEEQVTITEPAEDSDNEWKNEYKNITGVDPDERNITKEDARKIIDRAAIGKNVIETPLVKKIIETPTHVVDEDEKPINVNDLGARDLAIHRDNVWQSSFEDYYKSPEFDAVSKQIENNLNPYASDLQKEIQDKYNLEDPIELEKAKNEFSAKYDAKYTEQLNNSDSYRNQTGEIENTINGMFGGRIDYLSKAERLDAMELPELAKKGRGFFGSAMRQAMVMFPKAYQDWGALMAGTKIEDLEAMLRALKTVNPEEERNMPAMYSADKDLRIKPGNYKVADLIPKLEAVSLNYKKKFWEHMVSSKEYQDMLDELPKQGEWFDEDGNFELPDFKDVRGMFGTQSMQILAGAFTGLGSTMAQEAGGAFHEILDKKAAQKAKLMGLDYNKIPNELKSAIWLDIIEKGEGDLDMAMSTGATNTLLELTEAMLVLPKIIGVKPSNFIPKKFIRDIVEARFKKALTPVAKGIYAGAVPSIQSSLTEMGQEVSTAAHVGNATGEYEFTKQRIGNAGLTAFIIPAPLMGGNYTFQQTVNSAISKIDQFRGKPNATRTWINKAKAVANEKFLNEDLTKEQRDEIYDALEIIEQQANTNKKFNDLNGEQKQKVINELLERSKLIKQRNEHQNNIDARKKDTKFDIPFQFDANKADEIEIQKVNQKIDEIDKSVRKEGLVSHALGSAHAYAKWVNENQDDPNFKGKKFKIFTTIKELKNAMKNKDQFMEDYGLDLNNNQIVADLETIITGERNGANFGNTAIAVDEVIEKNIRSKNDWTAANTTYHEGLHFILENIPIQDLRDMGQQMLLELILSQDPQTKKAGILVEQRMADYEKKIAKRVKNGELTTEQAERQIGEELFTSTSDALQFLSASDLTTASGTTFSRIGDLISELAEDVIGRKNNIDYTALNAGNALDFIKTYNTFNGKGMYYGPKFQGGRVDEEDPATKMSESVIVDKVNDIYEKKGLLGYEDIISVFEAGGNNWVEGEYKGPGPAKDPIYRNLQKFNRRPNYGILKEDLYNEIIYDPVYGIQTAILRYDPSKGTTMAEHVFGWLKVKPIDIANKILGKVKDTKFTKSLEGLEDVITDPTTEDVTETIEERQAREEKEIQPRLIDNLPIDKKITINGKTTTYSDYIIDQLRTIIAQDLPNVDATKSKNKKTSDFISGIKKKIGDRVEGGQFGTIDFMGRKGLDLKNFLIDNKSWILKGMTTTWLARNFPEAVEKSVGGKKVYKINPETGKEVVVGFTPNFIKDWQGKKIDKEIAAVHGRTAQHQIMRRNPDAVAAIGDKEWVDVFVKENAKTGTVSPIQSKQEGLATQIAGEVGLELLYKDFENKGPLYDLFVNKEGLKDRIVSENIANEVARDIERGGTKMSESVAMLDETERAIFYDLLPKLGQELANHGNNVRIAFNKAYKDPELFGKRRDKIINDLERYVNTYLEAKKLYDLVDAPMERDIATYIVDETAMRDFDKSYKQMLGLAKDAINFRDRDQIDSAINAVEKIAHIIGLEKADKYLRPILTASGKMGGTKYAWLEDVGYVIDAMFDQNKIDKLEKSLQKAKDEGKPKATIKNWENKIKKAKQRASTELESLRTGLFAGKEHWDARIGVGFEQWTPGYKNNILKDASQKVSVDVSTPALAKVNKDSAIRNKEFLIELSDICKDLIAKEEMSLNDYGMIMKSIQGGTIGPLFAAAHVSHTVAGPISSKTHTYEHIIPRDVIQMYLGSYVAGNQTKTDIKKLLDQYSVAIVPNVQAKIFDKHYQSSMPADWLLGDDVLKRYFNMNTFGKINLELIDVTTGEINAKSKAFSDAYNIIDKNVDDRKILDEAIKKVRVTTEPKGITILDFDDTLATTESLVRYTTPDGKKGTLNAEQYAAQYQDLLEQGYKFDFTEFDKVVKAKLAPLFNKALKLQNKFGPENMFILTARPPAAQKAIRDFLKANGLNIPLKNITGLGNSTSEAKALWVAEKVGEGYNDFYFADDALQNVQAVKNMLDQFDVKSKVQQAKTKFSESMNMEFNDILEDVTGIESEKRFSAIKARKRGADKGKFRFFIPPSHEDFVGLLYNFIGKGEKGNQHRDFFEKALVQPLNRAYRELNTAKQSIANDYKSLNKKFSNVKKKLTKKTPDGDFTYQDAIRVYLWNKHGHKVPGLSPTDQAKLTKLVTDDSELQAYAEILNTISKQNTYVSPTESWEGGDIRTDLDDATGRVGREQFFTEFWENADVIFSEENLHKIEAAYGADVVSALKDILYRTKTGRNRPSGQNQLTNRFMNYLNGSVASTMFFNMRSAVLQQMSMVNFINYGDNNILAAAKAFANQKQYWEDWAYLFNSDFMKQRRGGIKTDINGAELAASLRNAKNTPRALLAKLLEFGFKPTQIGDNMAISTGGATFYRNRINTYLEQGMTKEEAESKAFIDFQVLAEATQQSARPDMVSQQQASPLGKVILAFQNVTSQFNRLGKKAFLDIKNRRITPGNTTQLQSDMSNASRIAYYMGMQNLIFYSLQTALFTAMFDDDDEDKRMLAKKERVINGSIDSVLRGSGVMGAVISTLKNMAIAYHKERGKDWNGDEASVLVEALNVSPPLGIKARKIVNAERTLNYNRSIMDEMNTFDIDNPMWSANTSYIEALTNAPLNRLYNKTQNVRQALDNQHAAYQRVLMFSGWSQWNIGLGDSEKIEAFKKTIKEKKKIESKIKSDLKKEQEQAEEQKKIDDQIEKEKQQEKEGKLKDPKCSNVNSKGKRCNISVAKAGDKCTIHESVPQNETGKKTQCKKIKEGGKRCKMQTSNKSGLCYYHD